MKRFLNIFLTISLLLVLTACGGSEWQQQYDLGVKYMSEGNYEEAIIAFTAAIEIDEKEVRAYIGRGGAYIGLGETDENLALALADYEQVIALDESNVDGYLGMADVYICQGEYEKALEILQQGLEKTDNNESIAAKLDKVKNSKALKLKIKRENRYHDDGYSGYTAYEYNSRGDLIKENVYDHDEILFDTIDYLPEYDSKGNMVRYNFSDGYAVCEYDEDDNCIRTTLYNSDGTSGEYWENEYDDNGNLIKENRYWEGELDSYCIYEYDENGLEIGFHRYYADGTFWYDSVYEY